MFTRLPLALLVVSLPVAGCGDSPEPQASPDAFVSGADAMTRPGATDAMIPGASGPANNVPGATHTDVSTGNGASITLLSSRLTQESLGGTVYTQWYGHVRNDSSQVLCQTSFEIAFLGGGGELVSLDTYLDGDPHVQGTSTFGITCIGAGDRAGVWTITTDVPLFSLSSVTEVEYAFSPNVYPNTRRHPSSPAVESASVERWGGSADRWQLAGTVRNSSSGPIYNLGMSVFPISADAMVHDELLDHHLETLVAGGTWSYAAGIHQGAAFADYVQHVDFLEGTSRARFPATFAGDAERALRSERVRKRSLAAERQPLQRR